CWNGAPGTCVSLALCLPYLLVFPFVPLGLAALLGIGTLVMAALGRRDDNGNNDRRGYGGCSNEPLQRMAAAAAAAPPHPGGARTRCPLQIDRLVCVLFGRAAQ